MRDDGGGTGASGSVVSLDSDGLRAALAKVTELADSVDAQCRLVTAGTPVSLAPLYDGGRAAAAAAWLRDQQPGLQSLVDLATLLETKGGSAVYVGTGTFAEARLRVPGEIVRALEGLDPDDPASRTALSSMRDLLGRYASDPEIGLEIVEELGGTGLVDVFDALDGGAAAVRRLTRGGAPLVAGPHADPAARHDPAPRRQGRHP